MAKEICRYCYGSKGRMQREYTEFGTEYFHQECVPKKSCSDLWTLTSAVPKYHNIDEPIPDPQPLSIVYGAATRQVYDGARRI